MSAQASNAGAKRWLWPVLVFLVAFCGGMAVAVVTTRLLLQESVGRDWMLRDFLQTQLAKGEIESRMRTIAAAERGDMDEVVRLNCLHMRGALAEYRFAVRDARDAPLREFLAPAQAKVDELRGQGRCGARR